MTLLLTCTSDPIHDIILNNLKSNEISLPPFERNFNLQCNADDHNPVLSDNIEDLFSFRLLQEKQNITPEQDKNSSFENTLNVCNSTSNSLTCNESSQIGSLKRKLDVIKIKNYLNLNKL